MSIDIIPREGQVDTKRAKFATELRESRAKHLGKREAEIAHAMKGWMRADPSATAKLKEAVAT